MPVAAKGAPEAIVDLCHLPLETAKVIGEKVTAMGNQGLRVLGVARSVIKDGSLPQKQHDLDFEFLGLVGLQDPIRSEVPSAIQECLQAGLRILMITGDHPGTALSIAKEIGLPSSKALTGDEIHQLSDEELKMQLSQVSVCARTVPTQKLRLVNLLKEMGEVVAMTGDGVNDAPALKAAHVGIAMGARGTDVAREAASIVLLDDDFGSIVAAIRTGRSVFDNLREALSYLFSIHLPIAGISLAPALVGAPLVFLPIHIAVLHLVIEPACSLVFGSQNKSFDLMRSKPRPLSEGLFSRQMVKHSFARGLVISVMISLAGLIAYWRHPEIESLRTMVFLSLLVMNLGLLPLKVGWVTAGTLALGAATFLWEPLRGLLKLAPLGMTEVLVCVVFSVFTILLLNRVVKK
jgi:Ca2+-transporting ATPase